MSVLSQCPICKTDTKETSQTSDNNLVNCPICGKYSITDGALGRIDDRETIKLLKEKGYILMGVIREITERNGYIVIKVGDIERLINEANVPESPIDAIDKILLYISKKAHGYFDFVGIDTFNDYPIGYARNTDDFRGLLNVANVAVPESLGYLEGGSTSNNGIRDCALTIKGWERINELKKRQPLSNQAFVAMWFPGKEKDKEYLGVTEEEWNTILENGYANGIHRALKETKFHPIIRMDKHQHLNKIDDEIFAQIRRSSVLVADFTGQRGGVYYEAGFASGLDIPVIYTCHEKDFDRCHFDTEHYPHIIWNTEDELYKALKLKIEATIPGHLSIDVKISPQNPS